MQVLESEKEIKSHLTKALKTRHLKSELPVARIWCGAKRLRKGEERWFNLT